MARKLPPLTEAQRAQLEALAAYLTQEQIADYFGMGWTSLKRMFAADPSLLDLYKKGQAKAIASVAQSLVRSAREEGNTTAQIFYLKTKGRWKEAKEEPLQPTDPADNGLNVTFRVVDARKRPKDE